MNRILIVDDDPFILEGMRRIAGRKFAVDTAGSGADGLALLNENKTYVAIVSDMNMRGMNGIEFLEKARDVAPEIPRMMLTGYADTDVLADCINRVSVQRFLQKPASPEVFLKSLDLCLVALRKATIRGGANIQPKDEWIAEGLAAADYDAEFTLHFQPRICTHTRTARGVEALIRWHHPTRGNVSPADFIPVSERSGAIREITNWVLVDACRTWSTWRGAFGFDGLMSINISPAQFADPMLVETIRRLVA